MQIIFLHRAFRENQLNKAYSYYFKSEREIIFLLVLLRHLEVA